MDEIKRQIIIRTNSDDEEARILSKIHKQLVGNQDYVDCRIVLNTSINRKDGTKNEIHLYVFNDSETDPEIVI